MSDSTTKLFLVLGASMAVAIATPAAAQQDDAAEASDGVIEEIEVTARKTAENIQEVPVAVTTVSATDLAEAGVAVLTEIQQYSPNTTLQTSRGTNSTLTAFIRGVGQQDPL